MDLDQTQHTRELLALLKQRLQHREKQAVLFGISVDPSIPMEIDQLKQQIASLEKEVQVSENSSQLEVIKQYRDAFNQFLRKLESDWSSERESDPINTDEGKWILRLATDNLSLFKSQIEKAEGTDLIQIMTEALRRLKALQRHQTFMDGGVSFEAFWEEGDSILQLLQRIPSELEKAFK